MTMDVALPSTGEVVSGGTQGQWQAPEFKVSGIFASHMVLQRDMPIHIRGFSDTPGRCIEGEFMGECASCSVSSDYKWTLEFSARPAVREGQTMRIRDDAGHSVVFYDILVGDVWVVGGQSNAELNLSSCMCVTPEITFDENESIRLFDQHQNFIGENKFLADAPQMDIIRPDWTWKKPSEKAALAFSAIGFYFARALTEKIDVPVGMVMACAGGACLRELMSGSLAHSLGYYTGANVPIAGYFNTLIHPLLPLAFKGMLYFQGESEGCWKEYADRYDEDLRLFVEEERRLFGHDFFFHNVQLSDYTDKGLEFFPYLDIVRVKQLQALPHIPSSTLTVSMDFSTPSWQEDWAHSPYKKTIAERLAALALAKQYGIGDETEASSPMPENACLSEDGKHIFIRFSGISLSALEGSPDQLQGFSVGPYENRVPAKAEIMSAHTVRVTIPENACAEHVNYAFSLRVTPDRTTLGGTNRLPCPSFSIPVEA